jgi:hypothetical protein
MVVWSSCEQRVETLVSASGLHWWEAPNLEQCTAVLLLAWLVLDAHSGSVNGAFEVVFVRLHRPFSR